MTSSRHFIGHLLSKRFLELQLNTNVVVFNQLSTVHSLFILVLSLLFFSNPILAANASTAEQESSHGFNCALQGQLSLAQCSTLVDVYQQTNGKQWQHTAQKPWLSNNEPCSWEGVECDEKKVVGLNLKNRGLQGKLPALRRLKHLQTLALSENPNLGGPIPDLSTMVDLVSLEIAATGLAGFLPDLSEFDQFERLDVRNSQFIGPIPEIPVRTKLSSDNSYLCLSPRLKYATLIHKLRHQYRTCRPQLPKILLKQLNFTDFGAIPNDNQPDDKIINHAITMLTLTLPRNAKLKDMTLHFAPGTYDLDKGIQLEKFENVTFSGVPAAEPVSILRKTPLFGNSKNKRVQQSVHGALVDIRNGKGLTIQNLRLEGQLKDQNAASLSWDHGIYLGAVFESRIGNNAFYHFGDSALTITSDTPNKTRFQREAVLSVIDSARHMVFANYFYNITQTSTTSTIGGNGEYSFVHNTFEHVKGAIKFATHRAGAGNLNIANNRIRSAGIDTDFKTNHGLEIEGYTNVTIENNILSDGKGVGILIRSAQDEQGDTAFDWGNVSVMHNTISNYRQGVFVSNLPHDRDGSIAMAEKIYIENNTLSNMWSGDTLAAIEFVGTHYNECRVNNNNIIGGRYDLWSEPLKPGQQRWMMAEGNQLNN